MLARRSRAPYKRTARQRRWGILFAAIAPVAVSLALIPLRDEMVPVNESLVLVVVVLVAAVVGGRSCSSTSSTPPRLERSSTHAR
jgi:hypothetical protein